MFKNLRAQRVHTKYSQNNFNFHQSMARERGRIVCALLWLLISFNEHITQFIYG